MNNLKSLQQMSKEELIGYWRTHGSIQKTAKALRVGWKGLYARMKELKIDTSIRLRQASTYEGCYNSEGKRVAKHTVVAEQKYGRKVKKNEIVHHKDGNRQNNSPENLVILTRTVHNRYHKQLEQLALRLYRNRLIFFKDKDGYTISIGLEEALDGK